MKHTIAYLLAILLTLVGCSQVPSSCLQEGQEGIYPDYRDVTIPYNIAPLNFNLLDASLARASVTVQGSSASLHVKAKRGLVAFPIRQWHALLEAEKGHDLTVSVAGMENWTIHVAADPIDPYLSYRLIEPGYEVYSRMGIYERDLTSFRERALLENTEFSGCVNCHSYNRCDPADLSLHIRGDHGATLLRKDGLTEVLNTKTDSTLGFCVYPYWHPEGNYIAYSTNSTRQSFHSGQDKLIEVFDNASDLLILDVRRHELISRPNISRADVWETFPTFSPDGQTLYFCAASPRDIPAAMKDIRYNLCRVAFDASTGTIGEQIDTLIFAESEGKSISFPRPSYDGRYLMYTLSDYGNFSIWHHEADLWLLDLQTGERRPLDEVNSADTESFHNWSSTSRWFVVASRRDNGLHTRPYFAHISADGSVGKPFMLPQRDPARFYAQRMRSFNVPDFTTAPVRLDSRRAARLITSPDRRALSFRWSD